MIGFKRGKIQKQYIEGLLMLEDGIKVLLRQADWHLAFDDLIKEEVTNWEARKNICEHILRQIKDIWDGKLHN